jgi:hypothetical protein
VTLRGEIKDARSLQGFRTLITWDATRFSLVRGSVQRYNDAFLLLFDEGEGQLRVDVGFVGGVLTGERRIFEFTLQPLQRTNADGTPAPASTLQIETSTEFSGENNQHGYATLTEGTAPSDDGTQDDNGTDEADIDNDGVPDSEDDDLNNNGIPDDQENGDDQ